jgi:hypothetical protein
MSLSDLASIGSFVSAVAVVVTLAFLTLQMRQTNRNQRALMQQGRSARVADSVLKTAEPAMSERHTRGAAGDRSMTEAEVWSYVQMVLAQHISWEDSFLQHRAGLLDNQIWTTDQAAIRWSCMFPGPRAVWRMVGPSFGASYRACVDKLMGETLPRRSDLLADWTAALDQEGGPAAGS